MNKKMMSTSKSLSTVKETLTGQEKQPENLVKQIKRKKKMTETL